MKTTLRNQWSEFIAHVNVALDPLRYTSDDKKKKPAYYWIRTRHAWPELSALMLYWLSRAVGTENLERGFSYQTEVDQDTRRRRLAAESLRTEIDPRACLSRRACGGDEHAGVRLKQ